LNSSSLAGSEQLDPATRSHFSIFFTSLVDYNLKITPEKANTIKKLKPHGFPDLSIRPEGRRGAVKASIKGKKRVKP
jgi:hypothetical protein